MGDGDMAVIMMNIRTADTWNVHPIDQTLIRSSRREENSSNVRVADKDDKFVMEPDDIRPEHAVVQLTIHWALKMSEETTIERRLGAVTESKFVSHFSNANVEAGKQGRSTGHYNKKNGR